MQARKLNNKVLNRTQAAERQHPHPGLATEFSGSSRLTLSMYRAQVRIFREKLNRRILRPGEGEEGVGERGGEGKANRLNDACLNICLARLGFPLPPACFKLPRPACQRRVYLIHFGLACESPKS